MSKILILAGIFSCSISSFAAVTGAIGGNRPSCRDDADVAQPVFQETRRPELCGVHHAP